MQENAEREARNDVIIPKQFLLIFNFVLPWGNLFIYALRSRSAGGADSTDSSRPACDLWDKFLDGTDDFRRGRLKMIPSIKQGHWVARKVVGNKPAIIGRRIPVTFTGSRSTSHLEIRLDVSQGGSFANSIANTVMGKAESVVVDLAFVLEAAEEEECPENVLSIVRLNRVSMSKSPTITDWEAANGEFFVDREDRKGEGQRFDIEDV